MRHKEQYANELRPQHGIATRRRRPSNASSMVAASGSREYKGRHEAVAEPGVATCGEVLVVMHVEERVAAGGEERQWLQETSSEIRLMAH